MANKKKLKRKLKLKVKSLSKITRFEPVYLVLVVAVLLSGTAYFLGIFSKENYSVKSNTNQKSQQIVYVRQYSDTHITENAKNTNPKFRKLTFSDKKSLLGNAISSLKLNGVPALNSETENGSWLWTPILQITPEYTNKIISDAKRNGIKNIYMSIDSYLDIFVMPEGEKKNAALNKFSQIIENFILKAREKGITVDAEAGWRNWAELGNSYKAFATLSYAIEFNQTHPIGFRSFQYDVEPYLLDYYQEDKETVLSNFINLIDETVAKLDGTSLTLSVVIPEFYDGKQDNTPQIYYAGEKLYPIEQLLRVLDKREGSSIIVMSYRNFSDGENGSIEISKDEVYLADKYRTKIIIAQETGDVEPSYITFFNLKKSHYNSQVENIKTAFKKNKSFNGIATHYVNSFTELK